MGALIVGISDLKLAKPPDTLVTYALGSCVGICLLDPVTRIGGLAHIMLPSIKVSPGDKNIMKFADTAIPDMVKKMEQQGAFRSRITAKIAGGAQMFGSTSSAASNSTSDIWQIGQRNVAAVIATLQALAIPIVARDVLENYGRTVLFDPATGIMTVKALNKTVKEL
ncbi:MAG: chemotaxis protein CheD [Oscillospiraceae bacterium]|jgi:chemotaxis protein CheD